MPLTGRGGSQSLRAAFDGAPLPKARSSTGLTHYVGASGFGDVKSKRRSSGLRSVNPKTICFKPLIKLTGLILVANPRRQVVRSFGCLQKTTKVAIAQSEVSEWESTACCKGGMKLADARRSAHEEGCTRSRDCRKPGVRCQWQSRTRKRREPWERRDRNARAQKLTKISRIVSLGCVSRKPSKSA